ncbi:hypothetical protein MHUMG1_03479 [Metarhizium humberi]|uniref:Uncharacterized protein n=1 Tax=Metarhizium humberi TaxID=2596975 RepID=A0A9P8S800_9HYPO|nr:hypothetical protein MHUMG1_03479 [Metarhizium humberi]
MGSDQSRAVNDVVATGARFKCTDPRDKVYGLVGISMERERTVVDHRKTVEEIYMDVSRAWIPKREIMGEFSRAGESTTKNSGFRPFLARLLHVLDIGSDSVHQILLPRNEEHTPLMANMAARMVFDACGS